MSKFREITLEIELAGNLLASEDETAYIIKKVVIKTGEDIHNKIAIVRQQTLQKLGIKSGGLCDVYIVAGTDNRIANEN